MEAEKEVIETLQKALQYCDLNEDNPKFPLYQYRAALIHYQIGSLYHKHIHKNEGDPAHRKIIIQLIKINYEKAANLYLLSADVVKYLRTQMQRFALFEYLAETTSAPNKKIKHLHTGLCVMIETDEVLKQVHDKTIELTDDETESNEDKPDSFKTTLAVLDLLRTRLQLLLKTLIKLCLTTPAANKDCPRLTELYKTCYKITFDLKEGLECQELVNILHSVLQKIKVEVDNYKEQ